MNQVMEYRSRTDFRFDAEKHQYWLGKKRIPGVSEILQKTGISKNYTGVDPFYRNRGIACHLAIQYHLKGILAPHSLDPAIEKQFQAFLNFWEGHKDEEIVAIEQPMTDNFSSFAGTPDLITRKAIYDWKCSKSHDPAAELQGEAYKILEWENRKYTTAKPLPMPLPFFVIELHDDASFMPYEYGAAVTTWDNVMRIYQWKTKSRSINN